MAKKELLVPFYEGKPCWYDHSRSDERKRNYIFQETFEITGFSRGCSSAKLCMRKVTDNPDEHGWYNRWEVFLTDSINVIENSNKRIVSGKWTFTKRGSNWGIKLVE